MPSITSTLLYNKLVQLLIVSSKGILVKSESMKVTVLEFLFLARIRFPRNASIASIVRKRYSGEILKTIRKFEKVDYKLRKAKLDINFLIQY